MNEGNTFSMPIANNYLLTGHGPFSHVFESVAKDLEKIEKDMKVSCN